MKLGIVIDALVDVLRMMWGARKLYNILSSQEKIEIMQDVGEEKYCSGEVDRVKAGWQLRCTTLLIWTAEAICLKR